MFGARISALYAINTAGAVTGAMLAGFYLIGAIGIARVVPARRRAQCRRSACWRCVLSRRVDVTSREPTPRRHSAPATRDAACSRPGAYRCSASSSPSPGSSRWRSRSSGSACSCSTSRRRPMRLRRCWPPCSPGIAIGGAIAARLLRRERDWTSLARSDSDGPRPSGRAGLGDLPGVELQRRLAHVRATRRRASLRSCRSTILMGIEFSDRVAPGGGAGAAATSRDSSRGASAASTSLNVLGAIAGALLGGFVVLPLRSAAGAR